MKKLNIVLAVVVVVILVGLGFFLGKLLTNNGTEFGAVSSPYLATSPCQNVGGVIHCAAKVDFKTATTTVCAIQSPNATSTAEFASVRFSVSSTTASIVELAQSTTAYATTTLLGTTYAIPANGTATIIASTTGVIFSPNTWFVVKMAGGVGTFSPVGACQAGWRQI